MNAILSLALLCPAAPVPKTTEITDTQLVGLWRTTVKYEFGHSEEWYYFDKNGTYQMGGFTTIVRDNETTGARYTKQKLNGASNCGTWSIHNNVLVMTRSVPPDTKTVYGYYDGKLSRTTKGFRAVMEYRKSHEKESSSSETVDFIRDPNMPNFGEEK